jgi:putative GTP pyrophosphokinase
MPDQQPLIVECGLHLPYHLLGDFSMSRSNKRLIRPAKPTQPPESVDTWLGRVLPRHQRLTDTAVSLIENMLDDRRIEYLSVSGRTKSEKSALEKIKRKGYSDPAKELTDLTGIRIITFFGSQVEQVCQVVREVFRIDERNSMDRNQLLGQDRIGYRSIHFVCHLGDNRNALPEYSAFADLRFELQVRTVLQHAWAELAHDRSYKFSGALPPALQRKLNLYSGMLEVVDGGFDEIAKEVDIYQQRVVSIRSEDRILDLALDSISLPRYLDFISERHKWINSELEMPKERAKEAIDELRRFRIVKLRDLDSLLTKDFVDAFTGKFGLEMSGTGFVRLLMMHADLQRYLSDSWLEHWTSADARLVKALTPKYGRKNVLRLFSERGILIDPVAAKGSARKTRR